MKFHDNYYSIEAKNYYDLGQKTAELFKKELLEILTWEKSDPLFSKNSRKSLSYLKCCEKYFPDYIDELKGISSVLNCPIKDIWALAIEDELDEIKYDRCSSFVTDSLICHNEDWSIDSLPYLKILKKKVLNKTIFELFYIGTLGGVGISINNFGNIQFINSLPYPSNSIGVPKNIIAKYFSESSDFRNSYKYIKDIKQSSGHHHGLVSWWGDCHSLETNLNKQELAKKKLPFCHTNHYLDSSNKNLSKITDSIFRYDHLRKNITNRTNLSEAKNILTNTPIYNNNTLASVIVDKNSLSVSIFLRSEKNLQYLNYPLNFIEL